MTDESSEGSANPRIPEQYEDNVVVKQAVAQLYRSHDQRFECDDYDPLQIEDGDEDVIYCGSCRFVVARLPNDEEVDDE